jgi:hypothetical protein
MNETTVTQEGGRRCGQVRIKTTVPPFLTMVSRMAMTPLRHPCENLLRLPIAQELHLSILDCVRQNPVPRG